MARKKLPIGEVGTIRFTQIEPRKWRARGHIRTYANKRVQVQGTGRTKAIAEEVLRANANMRVYENAGAPLDSHHTLNELLEQTIIAMRNGTVGNKLRVQSVNTYERQLSLFKGERGDQAIGNLPLYECSKNVITHWLMKLSERTPANAKLAKVLLSRAYDLTVMNGLGIWANNPTHGVKLQSNASDDDEPVALSLQEVQAIWKNIQAWQTPYKRTDLVGIVGACMATGFRINEVLAIRWEDVDLSTTPATIANTGTIVRQDGKLIRQAETKTKNGYRIVKLPMWFSDMLVQRVQVADSTLVFPNDKGGFMDAVNVRTRFRDARGEVFSHVKLKSFRSSVASAIANTSSLEEAQKQLGHASTEITRRYYVQRAADAGDNTAIMELFAPDPML